MLTILMGLGVLALIIFIVPYVFAGGIALFFAVMVMYQEWRHRK